MAVQVDDKKLDGAGLGVVWALVKQLNDLHVLNTSNPHSVTKSQVGLGNVDNKSAATLKSEIMTSQNVLAALGVTSGTAKYLREDGSWGTPVGTTYSVFDSTNAGLAPAASVGNKAAAETSVGNYYLCADGKYRLLPANAFLNTWRPLGTGADDACAGNDSRLSDSRPASDVYSWAKASAKPSYTYSEVGAASSGHTHTTSLASDSGTSTITLASAGKYKLTAGGTSVIFTMPTIPTVSYPVTSVNSKTGAVTLTASDVGAATSGHTHTLSIAADSGTNALTLAANTKYKITAGGSTFIFTTPPDNNTTYTLAGLMGSTAIGTSSKPVYWTGTAWSAISYTIEKSVPSNAVFTDTNTWRTVQCNGTSIGSNTLNLKAGTNVSLSNSNGTITITSTDTNTWRGIQDNLTSSSKTTESLSAKQGYLLANGSARDSTKLPLSGGTMAGALDMGGNSITRVGTISFINGNNAISFDGYGNISLGSGSDYWGVSTNSGVAAIAVNNDGKVGIGTVTTDATLYVSGTAHFDSGAKFRSICIEVNNSVADSVNRTSEINCYSDKLYLQYSSSYGIYMCGGGGNVGIGISVPDYKLHVAGAVGATGFPNTSDIRKKNILSDKSYRIDNIANAPIFQFTWKDTKIDSDLHIGSSAQYWKTIMPEAVTQAKDEIGTLSMQYDVIALASVISVAKETLTLKEKVALLETRVKALECRLAEYEAA